jgi:hypothetical protein
MGSKAFVLAMACSLAACSGSKPAGEADGQVAVLDAGTADHRPPADAHPDATPPQCSVAADCLAAIASTTPADCAEAHCDLVRGACYYLAKDSDGDGHRASQCTAAGVVIETGDDCDDADNTVYPGAWDGPAAAVVPYGIKPPGLTAQYYPNETLSGISTLQRIDLEINFPWGLGAPDPALPNDAFSARWTGTIVPAETGTYTFFGTSDDGQRLWVNNTQIIDDWVTQSATTQSGTIDLVAGQEVPIKMEYYEHNSTATALLEWQTPSQPRAILQIVHAPDVGNQLERCDTLDNDCSGTADDSVVHDGPITLACGRACDPGTTASCGHASIGVCHPGAYTCQPDGTWSVCAGEQVPASSDPCDGLDNDCDGTTDPGCACSPGQSQSCGTSNVGICTLGTQTCNAGQWTACSAHTEPSTRNCTSGADNDCNGYADNSEWQCTQCSPIGTSTCNSHPGYDGYGDCTAGSQTCSLSSDDSSVYWSQSCTGDVGPDWSWHTSPMRAGCGSDYSSTFCWDYSCDNTVQKKFSPYQPTGCSGATIDAWCNSHYTTQAACLAVQNGPFSTGWANPLPNQGCGQTICQWKCFWGAYCQGWGDASEAQACY